MCLVRSWKTGLEAMCSAARLLSQNKCHFLVLPKLKFLKKLLKPHKFACGGCNGTILCFSTRPCNHVLLLTLLGNKIASNKYTIAKSGMSISRRTCPIIIWIPNYLNMPFILINKGLSGRSFDILQNTNHSIPITFKWWVQELTNYIHCRGDIWTSDSEVIQFPNQSSIAH